jgi:cytochrome c biogenesis protein
MTAPAPSSQPFSPWLTAGKRWLKQELLPVLSDLRLAIVLLLLIAAFSISGTVIEQGQSLEFYKANYPTDPALFGFLSWKVLLAVGLDHVYWTWWFLSLLILFGTSLTVCTFTRQFPALKVARGWKFYHKPRQFNKLALSTQLPGGEASHFNQLTTVLQSRRYRVFQEGDKLYARKGLVGKIGPIVVHASMVLILLGAVWGSITGFMAQELIPSGNKFQISHIVQAGPWANIPKDWSVQVNRFWIDYSETGEIDQFYSDLSVLDAGGKEVDRHTIHVNQPLKYKGVSLYQADWSIAAVDIQLNKSPVLRLPMAQLDTGGKGRLWGTWIPTKPDLSEGVSLIARDLQGTILIYDAQGQFLTSLRPGMTVPVNGVNLRIAEVVGSTGLQIKADPGIPLIYVGFGLLMLGVLMSYISHSQIWVLIDQGNMYLGGRTNRAQVGFERELLEVLEGFAQSANVVTTTPEQNTNPEPALPVS